MSAIEDSCSVALHTDGDALVIAGSPDNVRRCMDLIEHMLVAARAGQQLTPDDVVVAMTANGKPLETLVRSAHGREIRPRTAGQRTFVEAINSHTLTFAIGPAGTGKTFLAVAMAVRALKERRVSRIILSRPAVEAGEKLGFLPGDLREKVDPYLRPLYDALDALLDVNAVAKAIEKGVIEIAPLAFMRGRTLSDAFVILDEAQNATREQIKMFITRLGEGSTMVVNGDITQIDLPHGVSSGLPEVRARFAGINDIAVVELTETDVVRHPLIARILRAYDSK